MNWHDILMSSPQLQLAPLLLVLPLIFAAFFTATLFLYQTIGTQKYAFTVHRYRGSPGIFNPTLELFRQGIIHPKTF